MSQARKKAERKNIAKIGYSILTNEELLRLAPMEVKEEGEAERDKYDARRLNFSNDGLYSESIFGISRDSKEGRKGGTNASYPDRNQKFGHIDTFIPYVTPLFYRKTTAYVQKILGSQRPTELENIFNWEGVMAVVRKDSGFLAENVDDLEKLKSQKIISEMKFHSHFANVAGVEYMFFYLNRKKMKETNHELDKVKLKKLEAWDSDSVAGSVHLLSGGYAALFLLSIMNVDKEIVRCMRVIEEIENMKKTQGVDQVKKTLLDSLQSEAERLEILVALKKSGTPPHEIVKDKLIVIPAGLRDMQIVDQNEETKPTKDGINDGYAFVINQAATLSRTSRRVNIKDIVKDPWNLEWTRSLNLSTDNMVNSARDLVRNIQAIHTGITGKQNYKSIVERLSKKYELNRQHSLSKRFDFTGRGVITSDPKLKMDEIGVPYKILMKFYEKELKYKASTLERGTTALYTIGKSHKSPVFNSDLIDDPEFKLEIKTSTSVTEKQKESDEEKIHDYLTQLVDKDRIIAIRYPTLHKWNVLGYKIVIVYDNTIHLHPLVCESYNADFDGDQMSLFLIQTPEAIKEVDELLLPSRNMVGANGQPVNAPSQDAVLGLYSMTFKNDDVSKDTGKMYYSYELMMRDYELGRVGLRDLVTVKVPHYTNSIFEYNYQEYLYDKKSTLETQDTKNKKVKNIVELKTTPTLLESKELDKITIDDEAEPNIKISTFQFENSVKPKDGGKYIKSTVGRFLFNTLIPQDLGIVNRDEDPYELEVDRILDEKGMVGVISKVNKDIIARCIKKYSREKVVYILDLIKEFGYSYATKSGMSMSIQDIYEHPLKKPLIEETKKKVEQEKLKFERGEITAQELREFKILNWREASTKLQEETMKGLPVTNPIKMMSQSGSRGNITQVSQLMGMRGLMNDTSGNTIDEPVLSSLQDGLTISEYFTASYGSRKGMFDRANKTKVTGESTRTSVYGVDHVVIYEGDCGDREGMLVKPLRTFDKEKKIMLKLSERVNGKISAQDILDQNGNIIVRENEPIHDKALIILDELYSEDGIRVRNPLSCKHHKGLCARCYGFNFANNRYAMIGDAVGISAAQTTGERGSQLTMRTFHTGGVAEGDVTQGFAKVKKLLESTAKDEKAVIILNKIAHKYPQEIDEAREKCELIGTKVFKGREVDEILNGKNDYVYKEGDEIKPIAFEHLGMVLPEEYIELKNVIKDEIQRTYSENDVSISDVHYETIVKAMTSELKVVDGGDSEFTIGSKIYSNELISSNIYLLSQGRRPVLAVPSLASLKTLAKSRTKATTAITYQNMAKVLADVTVKGVMDELISPITSVMLSNPSPTGTGVLHYTEEIKSPYKPTLMQDIISNEALEETMDMSKITEEISKTQVESKTVEELNWDAEAIPEEREEDMLDIEPEGDEFIIKDIDDVFGEPTLEEPFNGLNIDIQITPQEIDYNGDEDGMEIKDDLDMEIKTDLDW